MKIKINMIQDILNFNRECCISFTGLIFAKQGKQYINAKSLMGLYSLDLSKPIEVEIDTDNKNEKYEFYNFVSKWKVEE